MPKFQYNARAKSISKNKRDAALKKAKKELPGRYAKTQFRYVSSITMPMTRRRENKIDD